MSNTFQGAVQITATGANITTGAASARIAIPVNAAGEIPRYIRVTALNACHVRIGIVTTNAVIGDAMIQPADALLMNVPNGCTHIAAIQDTVAGQVNVAPLDNS